MTTQFLDLKSIISTASIKGKGKYLKVEPLKLIAEKSNKIESNSKIDLNTNGETIRSAFFEAIEDGTINLDFLSTALDDDSFADKCSGSSLLTSNGLKYRFFWKDQTSSSVKNQIQAISATSSAAKNNVNSSSSPIKVNSAVQMINASHMGQSIGQLHKYSTALGSSGSATGSASPPNIGGGSDPGALNRTYDKITEVSENPDQAIKNLQTQYTDLLALVTKNTDKINKVDAKVDANLETAKGLIIEKGKEFDDKIDLCADKVDKNSDMLNRIQNVLGLSDDEDSDDENADTAKLIATLQGLEIFPTTEPTTYEPKDHFQFNCDEAKARADQVKNDGSLKINVVNSARNEFICSDPNDNTKEDFNHAALKRILNCNYTVINQKISPGAPTIWIRCHRQGTSNSRQIANSILDDRKRFKGKLGINWNIPRIDDIHAKLITLKRKQIIANFKIGKGGMYIANFNDGDENLYNKLVNSQEADIPNARSAYIRSCTFLKIFDPAGFRLLSDETLKNYDLVKKVATRDAFYYNGEIIDYSDEVLAGRRSARAGIAETVTAEPGCRNLRW